jgi:hypothetical protein
MDNNCNMKWLEWAKELQFLAQVGLTYTKDDFDKERYERIRAIAAEMMSLQSGLPLERVQDLFCNETGFQTPKMDTRAAIFSGNKILLVSGQFVNEAGISVPYIHIAHALEQAFNFTFGNVHKSKGRVFKRKPFNLTKALDYLKNLVIRENRNRVANKDEKR